MTILVHIEAFEQFCAFVSVLAGLSKETCSGVEYGEGEQAKGERATIGELCIHTGLNWGIRKRVRFFSYN